MINEGTKNLLILLILFCFSLESQASMKSVVNINLTPDTRLFINKGSPLNIRDLKSKKFTIFKKKSAGFKPSDNSYWWKFKISKKNRETLFITVSSTQLDHVDLFYKINGIWNVQRNGDFVRYNQKKIKYRYPVFAVTPKMEGDFYLKVKSPGTMAFRIDLFNSVGFNQQRLKECIVDASFFSILLVLFIYNLFVFYSSKSIKYALYCLYLFSTFLNQLFISGWINALLDIQNQFIRSDFIVPSVYFQMISTFLLTASYLNTKKDMPISHKILSVLTGICIFLSLLSLNYSILKWMIGTLFQPFIKVSSVLTIGIIGFAFYKGFKSNWNSLRIAKFYFPAYIFYLIGALVTSTVYSGGVEYNFFTINIWKIGISLEAVLISLGLADIINTLRISDQKKSIALESLNKNLERKVEERTEELSHSLNETRSLLNNMKQSVFSIDNQGIVIPPVSEHSKEIFGEGIEGKNIFNSLFKDMDRDDEMYSQIQFFFQVCVGEQDYQYHALSDDSLPSKTVMTDKRGEKRSLKIGYAPIIDKDGIVQKIMLVVEDVTELENLEKQSKAKEEASKLKIQRLQEIVSNDKKGLKLFYRESNLNLALADKSVAGIDLNGFFRAVHTIKGTARMYGMNGLSQMVHVLESKIEELRTNPPESNLLKEIMGMINQDLKEASEEYFSLTKEIFGEDVDGSYLAGETDSIELSKNLFIKTIDKMKSIANDNDGPVMRMMKDMIMKLEMEDLKNSLLSLNKTVQRIATSLNKQILLKIEGDEIFLTTKRACILKDSIMHIIQNSCDHGVDKEGTITITLKDEANDFFIGVKDNGKGMDHELICLKAIEKGIISREESQDLSKKQKLKFIMSAGFSTKDVATEYSGRGVGMDVVNTNILDLGGSVDLDSVLGEGTSFFLKIPKEV